MTVLYISKEKNYHSTKILRHWGSLK